MSTEDSGSIIPFDNIPRYIPVDTPLDGIYPISYYTVTNVDLTSLDYDLTDDSLQPTVDGNIRTGAGGSTSIDDLIPKLIVTGPEPTFVNVNENTSTTFSVDVTLVNDNTTQPTFQWQKKESNGSVWNNIANAKSRTYTTPNTVFANDYLDQYRCIVTAETALNSPVTSQDVTLNVRRVINITTQPNFAASYFSGETATVTVGANITSGAISYQWQRKDMDQTLFVDIPTASGATYTTPSLSLQNDNTDIYRCVLTNSNADPKITNEISLNIKGADLKVTPGVVLNGSTIRFWSFLTHGPLILDSANATSYQVECIESSKTIRTDLWGQGSCNSRGGYSNGWLPMTLGQVYTVRLNAGRGSSNGNLGGGYAGIFTGTSATQASALLIAGGAGGGGRSSVSNCTFNGGAGGAPSGGNGDDVSVSQTGGDGGTQSAGGAAGTTTATQSTTVTYDTEGSYSVSIPSDAINVTYEIVGATGGQGGTPTGGQTPKAGGRGQRITGSLTNVAGQTLSLTVGSPGQNGSGGRDVAGGAGGGGYKSGGTGGRSSALSTQSTVTNDYSNSNFNYNLNIPSTITSITFDLTGGRGGNGGNSVRFPAAPSFPGSAPAPGGTGAWGQRIFATPTASSLAGKQLNIFVGGNGQTATGNNGFDFGGPGGNGWAFGGTGGNQNGNESLEAATSGAGGGGGGSSAILTDGGVMVVIAGGGGGGGGAAYLGAGGNGTTSTRLSTSQNFGNAANGQVGSASNASGGGGGSGQFDSSDGDGGGAQQSGNSSPAEGGKGGGGYYSTTYIQSNNISSSVGNGGGFVRVVYTALNESVSIASGGGGGGSSAITLGGVLLVEAGGGGGSGGAATSNTPGTPVASTTIGTTNNSSNGGNGSDACAGFANSGAGGGGGGNAGGAGGTSTCSGAEIAGGGGTSGSAYRNTTYVTSASVSTATTAARISISYQVPLNATAGSALQGGTGGQGTYAGGGGGGGYWGGGGAAGNSAAAGAGGGGGGSGFISPVVISGVTSGYVATVSGVSRGTAGDINGGSRLVFNLNTIVITQQPTVLPEYLPGDNVDLSVTATISAGSGVTLNSGAINYQWQRRLLDSQTWVPISGATNFSYTIPNVSLNDYNGNSFRCVLSNFAAATVITNVVTLNISGADLRLSPSVNGKTFWTFKNDGALILDPSVSTSYSIIPVNSSRTRLLTKVWGQGSCSSAGGYSTGAIPVITGSTYSVRLNAGAGSGGSPTSGGFTSPGGGYAGIFNGTTISQASALLIAGGAGGDGLSSTTCSGTTEVTETITTSTTFTETKEAGLYHERSGGVDTVLNLTGEASAVGRSAGSFTYTFYFSGILFNNTNYTVNCSNVSEFQNITANGTNNPAGFYPTILNKFTDRFEVVWRVNGTNELVNVRYQTFTAVGDATITNTNTYTALPRVLGGSGGGLVAGNGSDSSSILSSEVSFTSPGTYSWTCPSGVTSVSVVCVGGGGRGGAIDTTGGGGGGGGLGWKNNISVTPGQQYTVVVGAPGQTGVGGNNGGDSYFISPTTVRGRGGLNGWNGATGGGYNGDGGGAGGNGSPYTLWGGGGGGAAGYIGNGGNGGETLGYSGTGGGGGGAASGYSDITNLHRKGGGGGGVGIYGQGPSGAGALYRDAGGLGGFGGSGGGNGSPSNSGEGGAGGLYGGGGGATNEGPGSWEAGAFGGLPGHGAVRIIWGPNRFFPSSNVSQLLSSVGGGGGTQSAGGIGGSTTLGGSSNGSAGSALQGGSGGSGVKSGPSAFGAAGGGGGGGGYWGGGGGGGGENQSAGIRPGGGGGGGSGFVAAVVTNGSTSSSPNLTDINRGTAGNVNANSRIVIDPIILLITSQPTSFVSADGSSATFTISATISGITGETINYQWQRSEPGQTIWADISGATSATYVKTNSSFTNDHNARYRCVASNPLAGSVTSQEVYLYVIQNNKITLSNPGEISYTASSDLSSINVKIWGAGGAGFGECNNAGFAGGTGGFVGFSHVVTSGQTIKLVVGATDKGSSGGEVGSGAGDGGGHSALYINNTIIGVAGGGGGAGQSGFGGGGGGNGSGRAGSGTLAGGAGTQSAGGSGGSGSNGAINGGTGGSLFGGFGGGSGLNVGNRGGGGGSGYFGGGGGGGDANGNCTGAGGGGGSGFVVNTATNVTSTQGVDGVLNGSLAVNRTDPDYVANRAGSNQNGLIVIEFIAFDFTINPAVGGRTQWSLSQHGTLIFDSANATSYTLTPIRSISRLTKAWGQGATSGTQQGGYAIGTVAYGQGTTYQIRLNAGSGGNRAGGYAGIFVTSVTQANAILVGSGGGGSPSQTTGPGEQLGTNGPGGNATSTAGGQGFDAQFDNLSSANGFTGGALFGGLGGPAGSGYQSDFTGTGFFYYYGQGTGGGGGGGYFGGGGGGGGTAGGNGATTDYYWAPGEGGRGISFASATLATGTATSEIPVNAANRGTAGNVGAGSRVVIEP